MRQLRIDIRAMEDELDEELPPRKRERREAELSSLRAELSNMEAHKK